MAFLWAVDNRGNNNPMEVDSTSSTEDGSAGDPWLFTATWENDPNELAIIRVRGRK